MSADLVLASASPRRRDLLEQIGVRFRVRPADVDEGRRAGESARDYVARLAESKARAVAATAELPVLGADTTVVTDERVLGKPADEEDAVATLMALSGREHRVLTALALVQGERCATRLSETRVTFCHLDEALCRRYWRTGEPADKAGAYGIQGLGAVLVEKIHGSYTGVVGLPLAQTRELLQLFGIPYWSGHRSGP